MSDRPADDLERIPMFGIDGSAFPIRGTFGVVGKVAESDARLLEIEQPMGHRVRLQAHDLERALGGPENARALLEDAKLHRDAITIRFDSTGAAYENTEQLLRYERAVRSGKLPEYTPTEAQRVIAEADENKLLRRTVFRETHER